MSIGKAEFARRRKNLMALMEPNSIAIIPSAREQLRSRDTGILSARTAISIIFQRLRGTGRGTWYWRRGAGTGNL